MHAMRLGLLFIVLLSFAVQAQQTAPSGQREPLDPKKNQKIERIRVEDSGARIDELRVGGQTQQITVTTKSKLPPYEIRPKDGARVWNVLGF